MVLHVEMPHDLIKITLEYNDLNESRRGKNGNNEDISAISFETSFFCSSFDLNQLCRGSRINASPSFAGCQSMVHTCKSVNNNLE